jgi:hypothetical protein
MVTRSGAAVRAFGVIGCMSVFELIARKSIGQLLIFYLTSAICADGRRGLAASWYSAGRAWNRPEHDEQRGDS